MPMFNNDARLRELTTRATEGLLGEDELTELTVLSKAKRAARETRVANIAEIRKSLDSQGIAISELFSASEISAAAQIGGSSAAYTSRYGKRSARVALGANRQRGTGSGTWVRQKTGVVLLEVRYDGQNGLPSRYCKGQRFGRYVPKGLKLLDDGQLEANLARYYTEEGVQYFSTDAGKAELAKLIEFIKTRPLKPGSHLEA